MGEKGSRILNITEKIVQGDRLCGKLADKILSGSMPEKITRNN